MKTTQHRWQSGEWTPPLPDPHPAVQLALVFGSPTLVEDGERLRDLAQAFPNARRIGCSTAGEIHGDEVSDDTLACTAIEFASTRIRVERVGIGEDGGAGAGEALARALSEDDVRHVLVFAEGLRVNGSALARGLQSRLPAGIAVTGGLSGDGDRFERTVVLCDQPAHGVVVGVGLYGAALAVGFGSLGGWDPFGPERLVTRADGNVLYELDSEPALALYQRYLGPHADDLPGAGLRFPLSLRIEGVQSPLVRTLLAVDPVAQSITFAGDVPEGSFARLMKANFERLIDGASGAAGASVRRLGPGPAQLAVLVSCVGRKLVLNDRVEEELEAVRQVLGDGATLTGFYSYGELAPMLEEANCQLHNQTMTITSLSEA